MNKYQEWFYQSDYDLGTAEDMFKSQRYVYCIFMCHLSLEKALKGLYIKKLNEFPSKTHNLNFFIEKLELDLPDDLNEFVFLLNKVSIPTRYPEDLSKLLAIYNQNETTEILLKTKELQRWIITR